MKTIKIIVCLTIVVAAIAYAAKPLDIDTATLKGYVKTKAAAAAWVETNGWFVFTGYDAKSQIQVTAADGANILINDAKMIKQKGKISGSLSNIVVASADALLPNGNIDLTKLAGNAKFSVKLKGINVGTVIAKDMKMVLANGIFGKVAGGNVKGLKLMTQDGTIEGTPATPVVIGDAAVPTILKMVKAKKGKIGYVDATEATPAKVGKTKWGAKEASNGEVLVKSLADWAEEKKNKNVTLTTNVVTSL